MRIRFGRACFVLLLMLTVLVSCEDKSGNDINNHEENSTVRVEFNAPFPEVKSLDEEYTYDKSSAITGFEYRVDYLGEKECYANITEGEWIATTDYPDRWHIILSQGPWKTSVKVHYANDSTNEDFVNKEEYVNLNTKSIFKEFNEWFQGSGKSTLRLSDLYLPRLFKEPNDYQVRYEIKKVKGNGAFTDKSGDLEKLTNDPLYAEGVVKFAPLEYIDIPEGYYSISLQTFENVNGTETLVGGDFHIARVSAGAITTVSGNLNERLILSVPVRTFQNETTFTGKINKISENNNNYVLRCVANNAKDFTWFKNGKEIENSNKSEMTINCGTYTGSGRTATRSTYIDCIFTDANGNISSSSKVIVNAGDWFPEYDDSSVFSITNGNEIKGWKIELTAPSEIRDRFQVYGETDSPISVLTNTSVSEGLWTVKAEAFNDSSLAEINSLGKNWNNDHPNGEELFVNMMSPYLTVELDRTQGQGWIQLSDLTLSAIGFTKAIGVFGYENYNMDYAASSIHYEIRKIDDDGVVSNTVTCSGTLKGIASTGTDNKIRSSIGGDIYRYTAKVDDTDKLLVDAGTYQISLVATGKMKKSNSKTKGLNYGYLKIIVNVTNGTSSIVTGTITCNETYN